MKENPFSGRLADLVRRARRRRLDAVLVRDSANVRALTGIDCDNAWLAVEVQGSRFKVQGSRFKVQGSGGEPVFFTDFRYVPMVHRVAPWIKVRDIKKFDFAGKRVGCEFTLSHARFERLRKEHRGVTFVDITDDLSRLRSVKTPDEIARIRAAEKLDCAIWNEVSAEFRAGMTEREMARLIRHRMIDRGEGEAFETIVCVGANAAECHHVPDDTVWDGKRPVLVDMGVKLGGVCSDLTRNVLPKRPSRAYREAYALVKRANAAAIAAAKPGMTAGALDRVARKVISDGGFGKCFGHSLGHGVGYEIHEAPTARKGDRTVLEPGMLVTVEPGIYLEGNLGVRIEDLILITETGCEVLSATCPDAVASCYNIPPCLKNA